jgi:hypothetical protein
MDADPISTPAGTGAQGHGCGAAGEIVLTEIDDLRASGGALTELDEWIADVVVPGTDALGAALQPGPVRVQLRSGSGIQMRAGHPGSDPAEDGA